MHRLFVYFVLALLFAGCRPPDAAEERARQAPARPPVEEQLNSSDPDEVREGIRRAQEQYGTPK